MTTTICVHPNKLPSLQIRSYQGSQWIKVTSDDIEVTFFISASQYDAATRAIEAYNAALADEYASDTDDLGITESPLPDELTDEEQREYDRELRYDQLRETV